MGFKEQNKCHWCHIFPEYHVYIPNIYHILAGIHWLTSGGNGNEFSCQMQACRLMDYTWQTDKTRYCREKRLKDRRRDRKTGERYTFHRSDHWMKGMTAYHQLSLLKIINKLYLPSIPSKVNICIKSIHWTWIIRQKGICNAFADQIIIKLYYIAIKLYWEKKKNR